MGYASDLGTGKVAGIHKETGFPVDQFGHILRVQDINTGLPAENWNQKGTVLWNMTSPYGFLSYACGSGDDFWCFDYEKFHAGPLGEWVILDATVNSETGSFIMGGDYIVLPIRTMEEQRSAVQAAYSLAYRAQDWCCESDIRHDRKGWNQDPYYFARTVALDLGGFFCNPYWTLKEGRKKAPSAREIRFGGKRLDYRIFNYLHPLKEKA